MRHRWILTRRLMRGSFCIGGAEEHIVGGIRRAVDDLVCDVAQIHGPSMIHCYDDGLKIFLAGEEIARVHANLTVVFSKAACLQARIRSLQALNNSHAETTRRR